MEIHKVNLKRPPIGGKCLCITKKGIYILETVPSTIRVVACTHAGAGGLTIFDGVPDDHGFFVGQEKDIEKNEYFTCNGRILFTMSPVVMGSWALDGGSHYGLTIVVEGGRDAVDPILTLTWIPLERSK